MLPALAAFLFAVAQLPEFQHQLVARAGATASVAAAAVPGADDGHRPDRPSETVEVRGTTELSRAEAYAAARNVAVDYIRQRWSERCRRQIEVQRPFWLPPILMQQAADRWLGRMPIESQLEIVSRDDVVRDHEFGQSFQTTLWVAESPDRVAATDRQLRHVLANAERRLAVIAGGTVGLWAVLALVLGWLDRLSRGYMTWRLRLVGIVLGSALPTLAFLL